MSGQLWFSPYVLLRIAGLPWSDLSRLHCESVSAIAIDADRAQARLDESCERLCAHLHIAVSHCADVTVRRLLLDCKRAVFSGRQLPPSATVQLGACSSDDLSAWQRDVTELCNLNAAGDEAVARTQDNLPAALGALLANPLFRIGILYAQPRLYTRATKESVASVGTKPSRQGQLERTLLAYGYRMATKTSPFSAFTLVGIGRPEKDLTRSDSPALSHWHSANSFDAAATVELVSQLRNRRDLSLELPLYVNPTCESEGDSWTFLRCELTSDGQATEALVSIRRSPVIDRAVHAVSEARGRAGLARTAQDLGAGSTIAEDQAARLLALLVRVGILTVSLEYDANHPIPLAALADTVSGITPETSNALYSACAAIRSLGDEASTESAEVLGEVRRSLSVAVGGLQTGANDTTPIIRNTCFVPSLLSLSQDTCSRWSEPLSRIARVLPLFNTDLGYEQVVTDAFTVRFGRAGRTSPLALYRDICRTAPESGDPFATASQSPRAEAAADLRGRLLDELGGMLAPGDAVVELPVAFLDRWGSAARAFYPRRSRASAAFFGQVNHNVGETTGTFVLNKVTAGYGMLQAHWAEDNDTHPGRSWLTTSLRATLATMCPDVDAVELLGTFGFHGQLRPQVTDRCIVWPGEPTRRSKQRSIPWSELEVVHDHEKDTPTLVWRRTGRPLLPLHFGTLSSVYFPPLFRFMTCFGPAFSPDLALVELLEARLSDEERSLPRHYPRIVHDGIVVSRETWCIPGTEIPQDDATEGCFSDFRRLRRWAGSLGIVRRCFVTPSATIDLVRHGVGDSSFRRLHKPFFVDWDDYWSHQLFRRFTRSRRTTVIIAEMLPLPESLPADGTESRVTEQILEGWWT